MKLTVAGRLVLSALCLSLGIPSLAAGSLGHTPTLNYSAPDGVPPAAISTAGDLNHDGYSDLVIGYPEYSNGQSAEGAIRVFLGTASGVFHSTPDWFVESNQAGARLGSSVSPAGDVNGDGVDDLVSGAPYFSNGENQEGAVFVWMGASSFGDATHHTGDLTTNVWKAESDIPAGAPGPIAFGGSVATAGDLSGDGIDDIAIGAANQSNGRVYVWLGALNLESLPDGHAATADWLAAGSATATAFGQSVATGGDINGDSYADLVVGVPGYTGAFTNEGAVAVYFGQANFQDRANGTLNNLNGLSASNVEGLFLGLVVGTAGDVNGDGYSDVIAVGITICIECNGPALAKILAGAPGASAPLPELWEVGAPSASNPGSYFTAATAGDVNGDGLADVAVTGLGPEVVTVYFGRWNVGPSQIESEILTSPSPSLAGFGASVATGGDVNGDGFSDLALLDLSSEPAAARVYLGGGYPTATTAGFKVFGDEEAGLDGTAFGFAATSAGDVNGDGYSDIITGQPSFDGADQDEGRFQVFLGGACTPVCPTSILFVPTTWEGNQAGAQFGSNVSSAGDVNGDGFDDVVVGAPLFDTSTFPPFVNHPDVGKFSLYLGGPGGVGANASLTTIGGDGDGALFGYEVMAAGDVNGDGLGDVLVSAPYADIGALQDAGRVYLYLGARTATGLGATPVWTKSGTLAGEHLGIVMAGAGDVDGDGRSDALIGALGIGPAGQVGAFVFLGQKNGLAATSAGTLLGASSGDDFGISVASAGDVNGDLLADMILGEAEYNANQGRVSIYHGSKPFSLAPPARVILGPVVLGGEGGRFGSNVSGGGDVDGDGISDIVVGEQWYSDTAFAQGRAHVFLGSSPAGVGTTAAAVLTGPAADTSDFGRDVANNLDFNGDGFADVLVGAYTAANTVPTAGGLFLHFGNGTPGYSRAPYMRHGSNTANGLALLGGLNAADGNAVNVASYHHSAAGRQLVAGDMEVKAIEQPFDRTGLVSSSSQQTAAAGTLRGTVGVCAGAKGCRWRLQLRARTPFFPRTPWISPAGNSPTELDLHSFFDADGDGAADLPDLCPAIPDPTQANADFDLFGDACDNCASVANDDQLDGDADLVGNACDSCVSRSNPRVAPDPATYLAANPWATLTGGQRDDDHDGYGNKCDGKFPGVSGLFVSNGDLIEWRASNTKNRTMDLCGTVGTHPCAIYDLDETGLFISNGDLIQWRLLNTKSPGPKCPTCPLTCTAGTAGTCGAIP